MSNHTIDSDGRTVWVNDGVNGCCLGRFSKFGIDVHKTLQEQIEDGHQCLDCKAGPLTKDDWERFKRGMKAYYATDVSDEHMPKYLKS